MTNEEAKKLIAKYNAGKCTDAEKALLDDWYAQLDEDNKAESQKRLNRRIIYVKTFTVALAFFFLWYGNYMYLTSDYVSEKRDTLTGIQPGTNKAILILSNGKKVDLNSAKTGVIFDVKELTYSDGTPIESPEEKIGTQTLTTPKGGQYQLIFKDGTKIWLNADSKLTFKTGSANLVTREVSLEGEAYFEIAENKKRPFKVHSDGQVIEVLGAHFNVTAYKEDGNIKTTLLEGSVEINENTILKSGEQSTLIDSKLAVEKVDTDIAVAWKNGEFMFRKEKLENIMRKIARWYNVEVNYSNKELANKSFSGTISKFENVAEAVKMLELTGEISFKIEGRKIIVMP